MVGKLNARTSRENSNPILFQPRSVNACSFFPIGEGKRSPSCLGREETMKETIRLAKKDQQIADLLLQGCDNAEIAKELNMARRTVKARFNRLFLRFGINDGIKRVKLAVLLYRRQLCQQITDTDHESPVNANTASLNSLPMGLRTRKLPQLLAPPSMW
jgi:DNA-binding CsgD family transcriptional regulator